jgi:hypothetical protein
MFLHKKDQSTWLRKHQGIIYSKIHGITVPENGSHSSFDKLMTVQLLISQNIKGNKLERNRPSNDKGV